MIRSESPAWPPSAGSADIQSILVFTQDLDVYSEQLLGELMARGVTVHCVVDPVQKTQFPNWTSALPIAAWINLKGRLDSAAADSYAALISRLKPDVCLCYTSRALSVALKAKRQLRSPVIVVGTRGAVGGISAWYLQDWFSYLSPQLNAVVGFSDAISRRVAHEARRLWKKHPGLFVTIYPGYSFLLDGATRRTKQSEQSEQNEQETGKTIITVANERPIKGLSLLLDALERHVTNTSWRFVWIGQVSAATTARIAASPILSRQVTCMGYQPNARLLMAKADLYVQPTLSPGEGIGNAIAEAMASEVLVLTSDVGGAPELLAPEYRSLQTFEADSAASLGQAIDRLLANPALARNIGIDARQRIAQAFGLAMEADRYVALFNHLKQQPLAATLPANLKRF